MRTLVPAEPSAPLRLAGYAALFNRRDRGGDTIVPGAFAATLAARVHAGERLPLFWQHRPDQRIGWIDSATEDAKGLRVIATLDDPASLPARALMRGKVTGLSFGYRVRQGQRVPGGRTLRALDLIEVSLVTKPMQPLARVHLITRPIDALVQFAQP